MILKKCDIVLYDQKHVTEHTRYNNGGTKISISCLQRNRVSQPSLIAKQRKTNAILFSISLIFFVTWLPFRSYNWKQQEVTKLDQVNHSL